jgi:hypothetical protein
MTEEHFHALLSAAEAKKEERGYALPEGRSLTLYVASNGVSLTVSRVQAARIEKGLVHAQTTKGERYVVALEDCFGGSIDAPTSAGNRKAGFA